MEELREQAMESDNSKREFASSFDERNKIEALVLGGRLTTSTYLQKSSRLQLKIGHEGLFAR